MTKGGLDKYLKMDFTEYFQRRKLKKKIFKTFRIK